jgi:hypothetical protein
MSWGWPANPRDLTEEVFERALETREQVWSLLSHLGQVGKEGNGIAEFLTLIGRIAESDWIDGDLMVEIEKRGLTCLVHFLCDLGVGKMERVLAPVQLRFTLDAVHATLKLEPWIADPLVPTADEPTRIVFALPSAIERNSSPPELVGVAAQSLLSPPAAVVLVAGAAPKLQKSALDEAWSDNEPAPETRRASVPPPLPARARSLPPPFAPDARPTKLPTRPPPLPQTARPGPLPPTTPPLPLVHAVPQETVVPGAPRSPRFDPKK